MNQGGFASMFSRMDTKNFTDPGKAAGPQMGKVGRLSRVLPLKEKFGGAGITFRNDEKNCG
jgi:hypothetical protein